MSGSNVIGTLKFDRSSNKDRLSGLPTEILTKIMKNVIPNRGRMAIGIKYFGTSQAPAPYRSLDILCVSKSISVVAVHVLYGCRRFELAAETNLHNPTEQTMLSRFMARSMNLHGFDRVANPPAGSPFTLQTSE